MHDLFRTDQVRPIGDAAAVGDLRSEVREDQVELVPPIPSEKYVSKTALADREYMKGDPTIDYAQGHGY